MPLPHAAATDTGKVRTRNEDTYVANPAVGLFAVVDGMGGHAGGEVASRVIAEAVDGFVTRAHEDAGMDEARTPPLDDGTRLRNAVAEANRQLGRLIVERRDLEGAGATIVATLVRPGHLTVANVGDCRAYLLRGSECRQITTDHSLVGEQVSRGLLEAEAARAHPLRHVVTRAVSGRSDVEVDIHEVTLQPGDRLLLCSDGVHGALSHEELSALVTDRTRTLDDTCRAVVDAVLAHGAPDNATLVLVGADEP